MLHIVAPSILHNSINQHTRRKMNKSLIVIIALLGSFVLTGCYHAQVTTGLEPSLEVYEQTFASAWLFGLVPPNTVRAQDECRNGVARVETRLSFLNMLVGNISFGIYTPMHIKVTCAASTIADAAEGSSEKYTHRVDQNYTDEKVREVFSAAASEAHRTGQPVYVDMR